MIVKINPNTGLPWIYDLEIQMEDGSWEQVKDFYCDYATDEIHLEFVSGAETSFNLKLKYIVRIEDKYKKVPSKKKIKRQKGKK